MRDLIVNHDMARCTYNGKSYERCTISVTFPAGIWTGVLTLNGNEEAGGSEVLLKAEVVGGPHTPMGTFHASYWETDHVSKKYGSLADTPYSKTILGGNAFGPFQLHIRELEPRGIYIHGTMGPRWNPSTRLNALVSPTSHGCIRMSNTDIIALHNMALHAAGTPITINKTK
jgi:hypothetical protein